MRRSPNIRKQRFVVRTAIGKVAKTIVHIGPNIQVVTRRRRHQAVHRSGHFAPTTRTDEQPVLPADRKAAKFALCFVVVKRDRSVAKEHRQLVPLIQRVTNRLAKQNSSATLAGRSSFRSANHGARSSAVPTHADEVQDVHQRNTLSRDPQHHKALDTSPSPAQRQPHRSAWLRRTFGARDSYNTRHKI